MPDAGAIRAQQDAAGQSGAEVIEMPKKKAPESFSFIFVGDQPRTIVTTKYNRNGQPYPEKRVLHENNPASITLRNVNQADGDDFTFTLNGPPVAIPNTAKNERLIERLRNGSHFEEVFESEAVAA